MRARLGYVWANGEVLTYVTGGLAYGEVKINGTINTSGFFSTHCCGSPFSSIQNFSQSHVNTGWVLGYGNEGHLPLMPGNWTWKVETLYMDLGHLDTTSAGSLSCTVCGNSLSGGRFTTNTHFTDWILRGGLNYQFH